MSKKHLGTPLPKPPSPTKPYVEPTQALVNRLLELPRYVRLLITALIALTITMAVFPQIDAIYLRLNTEIDPNNMFERLFPSFITAGIGMVIYLIGWRYYVGAPGQTPPARAAVLWYFGVGIVAAVIVVALTVQGIQILSEPT